MNEPKVETSLCELVAKAKPVTAWWCPVDLGGYLHPWAASPISEIARSRFAESRQTTWATLERDGYRIARVTITEQETTDEG